MGIKFSELPSATPTEVASDDYLAILDSSENTTKKITVDHSSPNKSFGGGTSTAFGHVKLSDNFQSNIGGADSSLGASQEALHNLYSLVATSWTGSLIDWQNMSEDEQNKYKIVFLTDV